MEGCNPFVAWQLAGLRQHVVDAASKHGLALVCAYGCRSYHKLGCAFRHPQHGKSQQQGEPDAGGGACGSREGRPDADRGGRGDLRDAAGLAKLGERSGSRRAAADAPGPVRVVPGQKAKGKAKERTATKAELAELSRRTKAAKEREKVKARPPWDGRAFMVRVQEGL